MSWLNLNDSLNSLKGQITNFASNVLAEDEESGNKTNDYEELKKLCEFQDLEIKKLKKINNELNHKQSSQSNGLQPVTSWDWDSSEDHAEPSSLNSESTLKKRISELEDEKKELSIQLEQLDSDNQQNLLKVVSIKDALQEELVNLKESYEKLRKQNDKSSENEAVLRCEVLQLQERIVSLEKADNNHNNFIKQEDTNNILLFQVEKIKENYDRLKTQHESTIANETALKKEIQLLKEKIESLETQPSNQEDDKTMLEELNDLKEKNISITKNEVNLKNEIQELQQTIVSLQKLDSSDNLVEIQEKNNTFLLDNRKTRNELEQAKKELNVLKSSSDTLHKVFEDYKAATEQECVENDDKIKRLEMENKILSTELQRTKEEINRFQEKRLEDYENCNKLASILETYEKEVRSLKNSLEELRIQNEQLVQSANGRMDKTLEEELEHIKSSHEIQLGVIQAELDKLKTQEAQNLVDREDIEKRDEEISLLKTQLEDLHLEYEDFQTNTQNHLKQQESDLSELHNKYVKIITENIKQFQDCEKPSDFQHSSNDSDVQIAEFTKQVQSIFKILLDLRLKCEILEKKVFDLTEEKTKILTEKNHEIEKLMHNSEILSQELLTKTRVIKDYESEINELSKNNELLINELEIYKNNPGLQTISESNEDNMVLLETQLENANKRIEDLEKVIDDFESQQKDNFALDNKDNFEEAISATKSDYDQLMKSFDQLQIEYDNLKVNLQSEQESTSTITQENIELKSVLEKLKVDYENIEYQMSEININADSLKDETESLRQRNTLLEKENNKLQTQFQEIANSSENLNAQLKEMEIKLLVEEERRINLETQIRNLTEKLQNAKMTETSLKLQLDTLNKGMTAVSDAKHNSEQLLAQFETNFAELQAQNDKLSKHNHALNQSVEELKETLMSHEAAGKETEEKLGNLSTSTMEVDLQGYKNLKYDLDLISDEKNKLELELSQLKDSCTQLQQQLREITDSRNELINIVTTKHQENVAYHNEIQRLSQMLTEESEKCKNYEAKLNELASVPPAQEMDKLADHNNFLKEKCEVLAKNLLEEQDANRRLVAERTMPSEKELTLQKKLERLQTHLIELEERYTQELLQSEQTNTELQARVGEIEEREKSSSTMYTSVSIRANQQVESLQKQLQIIVAERDSLRKQISDAEDLYSKQAAALANLQFVLEQFRRDKEKDVQKETERIRRHITIEKQVQEELKKDIANLKAQLEESNQGLLAASRLSDQLEMSKKTITQLKDEVSQLQTKLSKKQQEIEDISSQTDGKVDKSLVKNLIIGFVSSNANSMNKDQMQILKIIATVLDFNQQDHDKVKLNKQQEVSWLSSFLAPQPGNQSMTQESLSQAFIKFLESESKPRVVPSLLGTVGEVQKTTAGKSGSSRQSPIVLSEIVLPTFADFAQNRNSSSILKDVLKDSS